MILLDTDHLTVLIDSRNSRHWDLVDRIDESDDRFVTTTVVSVEEQCRGWLAQINREQDVDDQVPAYFRFANLFGFLGRWKLVLFDQTAATEFKRLRKQRIRIGTQDLKVSAIALVNDALLLSANLRDFRHVPDLRVENWLE